uniref:Uncharacterized protein n=1 Tax=Oryza glumipatula TaxID=40148 RepID=A0A0D9ZME0_9ORYZ
MEAAVFAPPPDRHPGTASGGGGGGRRCCTGEDGRERRELDIQGRGCNEEVHPWTMTDRCVQRMRARRELCSWRTRNLWGSLRRGTRS